MNNRGKMSNLFPKPRFFDRAGLRSTFSAGNASRATSEMLTLIERSVCNFIAALPVVDVAFILLVIAYVKAF